MNGMEKSRIVNSGTDRERQIAREREIFIFSLQLKFIIYFYSEMS